ncbi:molybdopterin-dependent oxidoreductase [Micromonospora sp. WMMD882]|uniref:molybdopterin-dependent oxidoreductase n=1 Tax=Micromonospora sp. WMMD882 TaxID=3015151 RepID=UPI00248CBB7C|nr:molybdopterin-dependent oxidoreductase [Micromonospora sp. WMMD882]WBB79443.1 molybdopterin-dependent oxidoreductase [Micromonospora sp. WMMD882]
MRPRPRSTDPGPSPRSDDQGPPAGPRPVAATAGAGVLAGSTGAKALAGAAGLGVLAGVAGVVVAELVATVTGPRGAPLVAVGAAVIDATPTPVKEFAVRTFGTADKPLLLGGIGALLVLLAATAGALARRHPPAGLLGAVGLGAVAAVAALTRPDARPVDVLPALAGALVAATVLSFLLRAQRGKSSPAPDDGSGPVPVPRRTLLRDVPLVLGGILLVGSGAAALRRLTARDAARSREAVRLPAPASPASPLPAGVGPDFHTRNADFYRVDTALTVPRLDPREWRLRLHGMVDRPVELRFDELLGRDLVERDITLSCVSNEVGGPYVGTARWLGAPLAPLLRAAGIRPGADQLVARSAEGMTIGTPLETVLDGRDVLLAVGMNGEPLPFTHGFPVRMLTPGVFGYAGSCKWLVELEVSTFAAFDAYWVRRGWARQAPVRTASRIDRPTPFARLDAGPVTVAGVAWAQHRGIAAVEVAVDDGPWRPATLLPAPSTDTWVQWRYRWAARPGQHNLRVRATDRTGATQPEERRPPFPDGATGWHTIRVTVG